MNRWHQLVNLPGITRMHTTIKEGYLSNHWKLTQLVYHLKRNFCTNTLTYWIINRFRICHKVTWVEIKVKVQYDDVHCLWHDESKLSLQLQKCTLSTLYQTRRNVNVMAFWTLKTFSKNHHHYHQGKVHSKLQIITFVHMPTYGP